MTCQYRRAWEDAVRFEGTVICEDRCKTPKQATHTCEARREAHQQVMFTYAQWFTYSQEPEAIAERKRRAELARLNNPRK